MNKRRVSKIAKLVIVLAVSMAMALTPICAYAAPAQQTATVDAIAVNNAIANKDYKYIISVFFQYYGNYFRQHHQEANFPYFNATEYMKKYPDVAAACSNDPNKALEHYIAHGAAEGRSGCGKYDIVKFLKKYPDTVLSAEFLTNINTPEVYFAAIQPKVEEANSSSGTLLSGGGGGGSKGGSAPAPAPETEKSFTMMFYFSGTDLESNGGEMTSEIIDAIFGAYGTNNVNVLFTLGGTNNWKNTYLQNELPNIGEKGNINTAGVFELDVAKATEKLNQIAENSHVTVEALYNIMKSNFGGEVYKYVKDALLGDTEETTVLNKKMYLTRTESQATLMSQSDTLYKAMNLAVSEYTADNYSLIFSSHGAGCLSGACTSDDKEGILLVQDIATALNRAGFGSEDDDNTLAFLGFDACLMGSTEIATKLQKYYEFMYASEVPQVGDCNYKSLLETIGENKNKSDIANIIAYQAFDNRVEVKSDAGNLATGALFYSEYAQAALKGMDKWAKVINDAISKGDATADEKKADKKALYTAIKRALVRSYQMNASDTRDSGSYFDAEDFLGKLKTALKETGFITEDKNQNVEDEINYTIEKIDALVAANVFNFNGEYIYKHEDGQAPVIQNEELMRKYINYNFCGATFMMPGYEFTSINYNMDEIDKKQDDALKRLEKEYISKYAEGLGNYSELIKNYVTYMVSKEEASRIKQLVKEMTYQKNWVLNDPDHPLSSPSEGSYGANDVAGYDDLITVKLDDNNSVIRIIVNDYGAEGAKTKSSHSSGDAFVDLIDTTTEFKTYLTRKVNMALTAANTAGKTEYAVDIIIAESNISYSKLNTANANENTSNEIDVFTKSFLYTKYNYLIYDGNEHKYDALIASNLDAYGDKTSIMNLFEDSKDKNFGDYVLYLAEGYTADGVPLGEMQLLFKKNGDGENRATYIGAARYDSESGAYVERTDVKQIAFAHYTVVEGLSDDLYTNDGADLVKSVNTSGSASYFNTGNITLKATDGTTVLGAKYDVSKLVVMTQEMQYADNEIMHNGFFIVGRNAEDSHICFNDEQYTGVDTNPSGSTSAGVVNIFKSVNDPTQYSSLVSTTEPIPPTSNSESQNKRAADSAGTEETVTAQDTVMLETPITGAPDIIPVQAVIEDKIATDASTEVSDEAA